MRERNHKNPQTPDNELGPEQPGLVLARFGQQADIEGEDGDVQRCYLRSHLDDLVAGDRVRWRMGPTDGVAVAREKRRTLLSRPDMRGQWRPVAANLDRMVIVIAPRPPAHAGLIDRYLVVAEHIGVTPVLLLNKVDLIEANEAEALEELLQRYRAIGYRAIRSCCTQAPEKQGLEELRALLCEGTGILVGQSGVGKSSLIQALLPEEALRIGDLSHAAARGRHTTTATRLYHLPTGGELIDSPGIREFGLQGLGREQITDGFVEFRQWLGQCRFRDCRHHRDPGCALRDAADRGDIHPARWQSYQRMVADLS